jgi:hypothetical protein
MSSSPSPAVLALASVSAVTLHEVVLRRVEVDHLVLQGVALSCGLFGAHVCVSGFAYAVAVAAAFWASLAVWILVYRALWHPLRRFPGPAGARLTKWWAFGKTWQTNWGWHRVEKDLQKQYGDYVRVGGYPSFSIITLGEGNWSRTRHFSPPVYISPLFNASVKYVY